NGDGRQITAPPALRPPSPQWGEGAQRAGEGAIHNGEGSQITTKHRPHPPSPQWGEGARRAGEGAIANGEVNQRQDTRHQKQLPQSTESKDPSSLHTILAAHVRIKAIGTTLQETSTSRDAIALARQATERCLIASRYPRDEVGLIIHSGVYR